MKTGSRLLVGVVVAGLMTAPASAFFAIVHDPLNAVTLLSQVTNQATQITHQVMQITNQGTQIANELRNLTKLPSLTLGNITGEVQSVVGTANAVPGQVRGVVSSAKIIQNSLADATRTGQINNQIVSADGAVAQQQLTNEHLGNIESSITQGNAAAASDRIQAFANTAEGADAAITVTGNSPNASDKTPVL